MVPFFFFLFLFKPLVFFKTLTDVYKLISTLAASFGSFLPVLTAADKTPHVVFMFAMKSECFRGGEKCRVKPGELHTFLEA